ncbi:hypothetical protein [Prochlorococcus sp. MIT 1313]|uniref:hypothetical protein n=2 Tax=Prochlorococcus TaxID=1218 RepID=UPI0007B3B658
MIELYMKSFFGVPAYRLSELRMLDTDAHRLDCGYVDDTIKGDRGADTYKLTSANDVIDSFSLA